MAGSLIVGRFNGAQAEAPMADIIMECTFDPVRLGFTELSHPNPSGQCASHLNFRQMTDKNRLGLRLKQCLNTIASMLLSVVGENGAGIEVQH